ncbi:diguanylate cyclase domain-containing protein [Amphritea sp. HPY]|uniref:cache domain-containing protein n=1 Tax=Amphritea sp. HPY TaxID=3421652 RepID=UPI003D7C4A9C
MFALAILFLSLAASEALMMMLLEHLAINSRYFWIETFFDASILAFVTLFVVRYLCKFRLIRPQPPMNAETIQIQAAIIVFGMEALLMLAFPLFHLRHSDWQMTVIDSGGLALLSTIVIYYFLLLPAGAAPHQKKTKHPLYTYGIRHLCSYLFGITLFLLFLLNIYNQQQNTHINQLIERESQQLLLARETLTNQLTHAALDVLVLSKQQDLQQQLTGDQHAFDELTLDYQNIARIKRSYDQIRIINTQGEEKIRINRATKDPIIAAPEDLQNKQYRYYFHYTQNLQPGEVYISPMDLNIEHDEIEIPYRPIVRTSTPIIDRTGLQQGIVVINLNARNLLNQLDQAEATMSGNIMLLNEDGFWLHGGEPDANWAFMFPGKENLNIRHRYPEAWKTILMQDYGSIKTPHGYFIFQTVNSGINSYQPTELINKNDRHWPVWKLVSLVPSATFEAELSEISRLLILFFFLVTIVIAIGTIMYTRAQLRHHKAKDKIHHLAHHDALTGLSNRRLFMEMIDHELLHANRNRAPLVLMYLDLDRFKPINDQYGHESGDLVLKGVAKRLKEILRESDTVCRLGGDEFAAILPNPGTKQQIENVAQRILYAFEKPFLVHGNQLNVGISIGLANYRPPLQSRDALLHEADQAMYQSKKAGRNCYRFSQQ